MHSRLFQTLADNGLAAGFDHTRADEVPGSEEGVIKHARTVASQALGPWLAQEGGRFGEVGCQKRRNFFFTTSLCLSQVSCSVSAA